MRGALMAECGCAAFWLHTTGAPTCAQRRLPLRLWVFVGVRRSGWRLGPYARRDRIRIELADGSVFLRRITLVAAGPAAEEILSPRRGIALRKTCPPPSSASFPF